MFVLAVAFGTATGCGDEDLGPFDTGLDASRPLAELSGSDIDQICATDEAYARAFVEGYPNGFCTSRGAVAAAEAGARSPASFVAACRPARDACLAASDALAAAQCSIQISDGCRGTVGELEQCFTELYASVDPVFEIYERSSCDDLVTQARAEELQSALPSTPETCRQLASTCPGLQVTIED